MKLITEINKRFEAYEERKLSGSDQLIDLHILNAFNRAHWTETLRISDRELLEKIRLRDTNGAPASLELIRRSKQRLKAKGFIDFESGKGRDGSLYRFVSLSDDTPDDTPVYSQGFVDNTRVKDAEDVKTDLNQTVKRARARGDLDELSPLIWQEWINTNSENPSRGNVESLLELQRRYGAQAVSRALVHCRLNQWKERVNIRDLQNVLRKGAQNGSIREYGGVAEKSEYNEAWESAELPAGY